jgi:hypothetical protein
MIAKYTAIFEEYESTLTPALSRRERKKKMFLLPPGEG